MQNYLISEAIGDIAGSAYEGKTRRIKDYNKVKMFSSRAHFTDDTVLTFACAEAFIDGLDMTMNLWKCANEHRHAGFSSKFKLWMSSHKPQPYRSLGNGSAMRCSSAGWLAKSEKDCIRMATETAAPTHNHPEGIKGAQCIALCTWYLANHRNMEEAKNMADDICKGMYGSEYARNLIKPGVRDETCQGCVPLAVHIFVKSKTFEDAIRLAVSYGGDCDTLGAIVGSLAGAFYEIPMDIRDWALSHLPHDMLRVYKDFERRFCFR